MDRSQQALERENELQKLRIQQLEQQLHQYSQAEPTGRPRDAASGRRSTHGRKLSAALALASHARMPVPEAQQMSRSLTEHPPKRQRVSSVQSIQTEPMARSTSSTSDSTMPFVAQSNAIAPLNTAVMHRFYQAKDEPANHHMIGSSMQMQQRRSPPTLPQNNLLAFGESPGDFLARSGMQTDFGSQMPVVSLDSQYLSPVDSMQYGAMSYSPADGCPSLVSGPTFTESQHSMTRQSSSAGNTSVLDGMEMGRILSNASFVEGFGNAGHHYPLGSHHNSPLGKSEDLLASIGASLDMTTVNPHLTARPTDFELHQATAMSRSQTGSSTKSNNSFGVHDALYDTPQSAAMARNASSSSTRTTASNLELRAKETHKKHIENAKRNNILPKPAEPAKPKNVDTVFKKESKPAVQKKGSYERTRKPPVFCKQCDEQPGGFRGDHELRRHEASKHAEKRKRFICVDPATEGLVTPLRAITPLRECKSCMNKKTYGADYNAVEHLRRAHFTHKAPRGKKASGDKADKGGKTQRDHKPEMELLKKWFKEVTVDRNDKIIVEVQDGPDGGDVVPEAGLDEGFDMPYSIDTSVPFGQLGIPNAAAGVAAVLPSSTPSLSLSPAMSIDYMYPTPMATGPLAFESQAMPSLYSGMSPADSLGHDSFHASPVQFDQSLAYAAY